MKREQRIAELEEEIAIRQAEIRHLKENTCFSYPFPSIFRLDHDETLIDRVRKLTIYMTKIGMKGKIPRKVSELSREKIKIGNDFISEMTPIIVKYAHLFYEINNSIPTIKGDVSVSSKD